jgi:3-hydroxymyristoyl/3-hydroxydecanoyl-(acyl carrier protein) dehydratase
MDGHFRAFSFVDRITSVEPGIRIRGEYTIPDTLDSFPLSLVGEAVGQLAAWSAMAAVNFTHRPVAGIAGAVELLADIRPGQRLELSAELQALDTEAAGYFGAACVAGVPVLRLLDCVGPMVPIDEFDDPQALRDRFDLLTTAGATPGAFGGLPPLWLEFESDETGQPASATLPVPVGAPFFSDHFPRRPVFPGTLLINASLQLASRFAAGTNVRWMPRSISNVKLRTFIAPGSTLNLKAMPVEPPNGSLLVTVETRLDQRLVGSAEIKFTPEVAP